MISPNPSTGNFAITFTGIINKGEVEIFNVYGEKIFNESEKEIRLKNVSEGVYFVKVRAGEKNYCRKIIIE